MIPPPTPSGCSRHGCILVPHGPPDEELVVLARALHDSTRQQGASRASPPLCSAQAERLANRSISCTVTVREGAGGVRVAQGFFDSAEQCETPACVVASVSQMSAPWLHVMVAQGEGRRVMGGCVQASSPPRCSTPRRASARPSPPLKPKNDSSSSPTPDTHPPKTTPSS